MQSNYSGAPVVEADAATVDALLYQSRDQSP